jgi:hypothetical protein
MQFLSHCAILLELILLLLQFLQNLTTVPMVYMDLFPIHIHLIVSITLAITNLNVGSVILDINGVLVLLAAVDMVEVLNFLMFETEAQCLFFVPVPDAVEKNVLDKLLILIYICQRLANYINIMDVPDYILIASLLG